MAWIAKDENESYSIYENKPTLNESDFVQGMFWRQELLDEGVVIITKSLAIKILGKEMNYSDEPIEI
jgi:hypothetical protein